MNQNKKIAIPTCEGELWPHFGKAPQVTIITIENDAIKETIVKEAPAMPRFLAAEGCTDVICGGLGQGAIQMLEQLGIKVHAGAPTLPVEQVVSMFLSGTIEYGDGSCHHDACDGHHHHHE